MKFFGEEVKKRTEGFHTWYKVEVKICGNVRIPIKKDTIDKALGE